jgi:hypothetical protein
VICPKCGEDNSGTFRFCGMCGTSLEPGPAAKAADKLSTLPSSEPVSSSSISRPAPRATFPSPSHSTSTPAIVPVQEPAQRSMERNTFNAPETRRQSVMETAPPERAPERAPQERQRERSVPPISGPSMLGLDQPGPISATSPRNAASDLEFDRPSTDRATLKSSRFDDDLSSDSLRQRSFSGLDSYMEPSNSGARRVVLLFVLLAALGGAGWWAYNNYIGLVQSRRAQSDTSSVIEPPTDSASSKPTAPEPAPAPVPPAGTAQSATPPSDVAEGPSENASPAPASTTTSSADAAPVRPAPRPAPVAKAQPPKPAPKQIPPRHEPAMAAATASRIPATPPADTGDASFRKAEAYLYGRGAAQNCNEAIKNLKDASAKSNAKARSTFGTLYATGHCVPRDLPTSYLWFALALRVDPNNQILEKDLTAVWNQMTPPERQMATRMKQ